MQSPGFSASHGSRREAVARRQYSILATSSQIQQTANSQSRLFRRGGARLHEALEPHVVQHARIAKAWSSTSTTRRSGPLDALQNRAHHPPSTGRRFNNIGPPNQNAHRRARIFSFFSYHTKKRAVSETCTCLSNYLFQQPTIDFHHIPHHTRTFRKYRKPHQTFK